MSNLSQYKSSFWNMTPNIWGNIFLVFNMIQRCRSLNNIESLRKLLGGIDHIHFHQQI